MGGRAHARDIVVVGASAGGLEALTALLGSLPADLPAAVLIVQHRGDRGTDHLTPLLAHATALPVASAADGERVRRGRVCVCPADTHLTVEHGLVRLDHGPKENGLRPSVDVLFRSAAQAYGARVIAVVLSGMGSDGTAGVAEIKERGGIAIAQDPFDAEFSAMPTHVLERVPIDYCLPASQIGPKLVELTAS